MAVQGTTGRIRTATAKATPSPNSEDSGEKIAHTGPPAATRDAAYTYLARVVVGGEPATQAFPQTGEPLYVNHPICPLQSNKCSSSIEPAARKSERVAADAPHQRRP